jgi:hypothetical protein
VSLARRAGRLIGRTLSEVVSLLKPSVIGAELAAGTDYGMAGVRETGYARTMEIRFCPQKLERPPQRGGTAVVAPEHQRDQ